MTISGGENDEDIIIFLSNRVCLRPKKMSVYNQVLLLRDWGPR